MPVSATCWHSLCDCVPEETGVDAAVRNENGGALAMDAVVCGSDCVRKGVGRKHREACSRYQLGWVSDGLAGIQQMASATTVAGAHSEYTESDRDTEDVQEANGAGLRPPEVDAGGIHCGLWGSGWTEPGICIRLVRPVVRWRGEGSGDEEAEEGSACHSCCYPVCRRSREGHARGPRGFA